MDKKILAVVAVVVIVIAAAAVIMLKPGDSGKDSEKSGYTVSFDANGGSGTMASVTGISGIYTLPECKFTAPEGYSFDGWSKTKTIIITSDTTEIDSDTTLYAMWTNDNDKTIRIIGSYSTDVSPFDDIISKISFSYKSGNYTNTLNMSEVKYGSIVFKYFGEASFTINVDGATGWSQHTGRLPIEDSDDFVFFEFTYDGTKYSIGLTVSDAKFSGTVDPEPTFSFTYDGNASMLIYISKVA